MGWLEGSKSVHDGSYKQLYNMLERASGPSQEQLVSILTEHEDGLLMSTKAFKPFTSSGAQNKKEGKVRYQGKEETLSEEGVKFVADLAKNYLGLDEDTSNVMYHFHCCPSVNDMYQDSTKGMAMEVYLEERRSRVKALCAILVTSRDDQHPWQSTCLDAVQKLCDKGLVDELMNDLTDRARRRPPQHLVDSQGTDMMGGLLRTWVNYSLLEECALMEALFLCFYSTVEGSPEMVRRLLECMAYVDKWHWHQDVIEGAGLVAVHRMRLIGVLTLVEVMHLEAAVELLVDPENAPSAATNHPLLKAENKDTLADMAQAVENWASPWAAGADAMPRPVVLLATAVLLQISVLVTGASEGGAVGAAEDVARAKPGAMAGRAYGQGALSQLTQCLDHGSVMSDSANMWTAYKSVCNGLLVAVHHAFTVAPLTETSSVLCECYAATFSGQPDIALEYWTGWPRRASPLDVAVAAFPADPAPLLHLLQHMCPCPASDRLDTAGAPQGGAAVEEAHVKASLAAFELLGRMPTTTTTVQNRNLNSPPPADQSPSDPDMVVRSEHDSEPNPSQSAAVQAPAIPAGTPGRRLGPIVPSSDGQTAENADVLCNVVWSLPWDAWPSLVHAMVAGLVKLASAVSTTAALATSAPVAAAANAGPGKPSADSGSGGGVDVCTLCCSLVLAVLNLEDHDQAASSMDDDGDASRVKAALGHMHGLIIGAMGQWANVLRYTLQKHLTGDQSRLFAGEAAPSGDQARTCLAMLVGAALVSPALPASQVFSRDHVILVRLLTRLCRRGASLPDVVAQNLAIALFQSAMAAAGRVQGDGRTHTPESAQLQEMVEAHLALLVALYTIHCGPMTRAAVHEYVGGVCRMSATLKSSTRVGWKVTSLCFSAARRVLLSETKLSLQQTATGLSRIGGNVSDGLEMEQRMIGAVEAAVMSGLRLRPSLVHVMLRRGHYDHADALLACVSETYHMLLYLFDSDKTLQPSAGALQAATALRHRIASTAEAVVSLVQFATETSLRLASQDNTDISVLAAKLLAQLCRPWVQEDASRIVVGLRGASIGSGAAGTSLTGAADLGGGTASDFRATPLKTSLLVTRHTQNGDNQTAAGTGSVVTSAVASVKGVAAGALRIGSDAVTDAALSTPAISRRVAAAIRNTMSSSMPKTAGEVGQGQPVVEAVHAAFAHQPTLAALILGCGPTAGLDSAEAGGGDGASAKGSEAKVAPETEKLTTLPATNAGKTAVASPVVDALAALAAGNASQSSMQTRAMALSCLRMVQGTGAKAGGASGVSAGGEATLTVPRLVELLTATAVAAAHAGRQDPTGQGASDADSSELKQLQDTLTKPLESSSSSEDRARIWPVGVTPPLKDHVAACVAFTHTIHMLTVALARKMSASPASADAKEAIPQAVWTILHAVLCSVCRPAEQSSILSCTVGVALPPMDRVSGLVPEWVSSAVETARRKALHRLEKVYTRREKVMGYGGNYVFAFDYGAGLAQADDSEQQPSTLQPSSPSTPSHWHAAAWGRTLGLRLSSVDAQADCVNAIAGLLAVAGKLEEPGRSSPPVPGHVRKALMQAVHEAISRVDGDGASDASTASGLLAEGGTGTQEHALFNAKFLPDVTDHHARCIRACARVASSLTYLVPVADARSRPSALDGLETGTESALHIALVGLRRGGLQSVCQVEAWKQCLVALLLHCDAEGRLPRDGFEDSVLRLDGGGSTRLLDAGPDKGHVGAGFENDKLLLLVAAAAHHPDLTIVSCTLMDVLLSGCSSPAAVASQLGSEQVVGRLLEMCVHPSAAEDQVSLTRATAVVQLFTRMAEHASMAQVLCDPRVEQCHVVHVFTRYFDGLLFPHGQNQLPGYDESGSAKTMPPRLLPFCL